MLTASPPTSRFLGVQGKSIRGLGGLRLLEVFDDVLDDGLVDDLFDLVEGALLAVVVGVAADGGVVVALVFVTDDFFAVAVGALVEAGLDGEVHAALGVDHQLFAAVLVLEADLVVAAGVGRGIGADGADGLVGGEGVGDLVVEVVDAPGDDGAIWIALQELDDDLVPGAGDEHRA